MQKNNNERVIYMASIAVELRNRGFKILRTEVNFKNPQYDVYIFEKTEDLNRALEEILKKKNRHKI
jgi:hypothetical protein